MTALPADNPAKALVEDVRATLLRLLSEAIPSGSRVALVDFPNHPNVGDTAIWLGELAALRELGCDIAYVSARQDYSKRTLERRLGTGGLVLLHGGGNFGDVWPAFQRFREQVVAEHPKRQLVQLPQTIHFADEANLSRSRETLGRHPDLTLFVRDARSRDVATAAYPDTRVLLCPDSAFALGTLEPTKRPSGILLLARTDAESRLADAQPLPADVRVADWLGRSLTQTARKAVSLGLSRLLAGERSVPFALGAQERVYASLSKQRLGVGVDLLSSAQVVVTDRLHGHILSLLLGRRHVLLDNNYGKNRSFVDAWTSSSPLTTPADSLPEALEIARSQVAAAGG